MPKEFAGMHGALELEKVTSRLILTNGNLDPWMPGGFNKSLSKSIVYYLVEDGAHHLDLREDHKGDPQSVVDIRNKIERTIG